MQELLVDITDRTLGDIFFYNLLNEVVTTTIPVEIRKFFEKKQNRKDLFNEIGEQGFLLPKELKFPIVNPFTKEIDCRLVYAALIRAKQHKYSEVEKEAKKLFEKHKCNEELKIILKEDDCQYPFQFSGQELFEFFGFDNTPIFENQESYKKLFNNTLKRFNAESIIDLSESDKKKFFNILEKNWTKEVKK